MTVSFEFQPTLIGPRLTVRPMTGEDWDETFSAASDPKIWALHPDPSRYLEPAFRGYFDGGLASGSAFVFIDNKSGAIVGSSRYNGFDPVAGEIEIGWTFLTRAYWGGSYNAEVKRLMLEHAFKFVDTVVFWVGSHNLRSRRAMEKIGGALREGNWSRPFNGREDPYVVYEMRKSG